MRIRKQAVEIILWMCYKSTHAAAHTVHGLFSITSRMIHRGSSSHCWSTKTKKRHNWCMKTIEARVNYRRASGREAFRPVSTSASNWIQTPGKVKKNQMNFKWKKKDLKPATSAKRWAIEVGSIYTKTKQKKNNCERAQGKRSLPSLARI